MFIVIFYYLQHFAYFALMENKTKAKKNRYNKSQKVLTKSINLEQEEDSGNNEISDEDSSVIIEKKLAYFTSFLHYFYAIIVFDKM